MVATLLIAAALLLQTPATGASVSGVVVNAVTGSPVANVRVTLMRTDIAQPSSVDRYLSETRAPSGVLLPGEWWNQIASKDAVDSATAAGISASDIRQIQVRPDRSVAIALADPVTTDGQGIFAFKNVRPGTYRLTVVANGYTQPDYNIGVAPIAVTDGQSIHLQLPILAAGAVSGRIRDQAGQPIPDIPVQLIRFAYDATGRKKIQVVASAHTNDLGDYRLYFVPPGRYYLQASSSYGDFIPSSSNLAAKAADDVIQDSFVNTFYPGVSSIEFASPIDVKPGSEVERADFSMTRLPEFRVRGRIISDLTRKPPDDAEIALSSGSPVGSVSGSAELIAIASYDRKDGSFEIERVPPGSYAITVHSKDSEVGVAGPVTISTTDADLGELHVRSPIILAGIIRMEIQRPFPAGLALNKLRVRLDHDSLDFQPYRIQINPDSSPATNGSLRIAQLVQGDYRVSVSNLPEGIYLKEVRFGDTDVLKDVLRVRGPTPDILEIVLASDPGRIEGQAAPGAQIVLVPDQRNRKDLFKSVIAGTNGKFTFTGIPPGDYKLFAWESLERYAFFDPEVLGSAETHGVSIRVAASTTQTAIIASIPGAP